MRMFRRLVNKYFGNYTNLIIWTFAVFVTLLVLDNFIFVEKDSSPIQDPHGVKLADGRVKEISQKTVVSRKSSSIGLIKPKSACDQKCLSGEYHYSVISGNGINSSPTICFNGVDIISTDLGNGMRGLNIVVVNPTNGKIEAVKAFDTYTEGDSLVRFLEMGVPLEHVILVSSMDEASTNIGNTGKLWLGKFGSSQIEKIRFRSGFVMIGQRGLTRGSAIEKLIDRVQDEEFPASVSISGCATFPIGKLDPLPIEVVQRDPAKDSPTLKLGEELPHCGVKQLCGTEAFPIHLYTGKNNADGPKICVSGKYVIAKGLNDGGRGLNIAIIDPLTKEASRVGHFDTYAEDSSNLEIFLEMLKPNDIVLVVAHDDASKKLSDHAKRLFNDMGSSMIQNLKFRDVWALVGQEGIKGYSEIEQLEGKAENLPWPLPIDKRLCIPIKLKSSMIKPDPGLLKNERRRRFCAKYDGYSDFCSPEYIDGSLVAAPVSDKIKASDPIYSIPIILIPGLNHNAARLQFETLLLQPGINTNNIVVMYDEKFDESARLASLFKFKSEGLSSSTKYTQQVEKALHRVFELFPAAQHVIVLEEEVLIGPDFISFMSQCLHPLEEDNTLLGVSAWNYNGYSGTSSIPSLVYRQEIFPGFGFLLKRSFYDKYMSEHMNDCCTNRTWYGWFPGRLVNLEMLVPDMSRVHRPPYEGLSEHADFLTELFNRPRATFLEDYAQISNLNLLKSQEYDKELVQLIKDGIPLETSHVNDCVKELGLGFYIPSSSNKMLTIFFIQNSKKDYSSLSILTRCFNLFYVPKFSPRGMHKNTIRFTYKNSKIILIGSESPFYHLKPSSYSPMSLSHS